MNTKTDVPTSSVHRFVRLVVCAAIRNPLTHEIVCGPRHGNALNLVHRGRNFIPSWEEKKWECGFVDQDGKFMTRAEAWKVADAAGQIRRPKGHERDYAQHRPAGIGDEGQLFSENLY